MSETAAPYLTAPAKQTTERPTCDGCAWHAGPCPLSVSLGAAKCGVWWERQT